MARGQISLVVFVALTFATVAHGQDRFTAKVLLGAPTTFDVDLEYHDPGELDRRLNGSRVIPIWMSVKNVSGQTARFDYADVRLDVGGGPGQTALEPVTADQAREQLRRDGHYNLVVRLLASRDRVTGEPFNRRLPDGSLGPGQSKRGYVFFFRRDGVPFHGFMAISTVGRVSELLPTARVDVPGAQAATRSADLVASAINRIWHGPPPFGESYAILFGIAEYDAKTPLPGVSSDLAAMRAYLQSQGFKPAIVKANKDVTGDTLRDVQRHFSGKLTSQDRLLVYYAGHGRLFKDRGYLVLSASQDTFDAKTNIPMDEFVFWMQALPVKHLLVILDACFAGAAIPGTTRAADFGTEHRLDGQDQEILRDLASAGGKFVLMAATDQQRANEDKRGGLFTRALLTSLKEPGPDTSRLVTTMGAFSRARDIVSKEVLQRRLEKQMPVFKDLGAVTQGSAPSKGEFVFVRPNAR